jgi:hypothetical protein
MDFLIEALNCILERTGGSEKRVRGFETDFGKLRYCAGTRMFTLNILFLEGPEGGETFFLDWRRAYAI